MSKAATEKELSHRNFDIDKATLHTICVTSDTLQLLPRGRRHTLFLSLVFGKFVLFHVIVTSPSVCLYSFHLTNIYCNVLYL